MIQVRMGTLVWDRLGCVFEWGEPPQEIPDRGKINQHSSGWKVSLFSI